MPVVSAVTLENVNILNNFEMFESDSKSVPVKLHKYLYNFKTKFIYLLNKDKEG